MSSPFAFLFCFFFLISSSHAFNITKILGKYGDFANFDNLLTQSGLAKEINQQHTVTVLVVSNGNAAALSGKSNDVIKRVLSVHVVLDYYDEKKLKEQQSKHAKTLTTLYQQSGEARNGVGFLNMTNSGKGPTVFKSASRDNDVEAQLVKEVTAEPYDISVLEVSNILNVASSISISPTASHDSQAPKASRHRKALTPAPADAPSSDDVDGGSDSPSPSPSKSKTKQGKGKGDGDVGAGSGAGADADAPAADAPGTSSAVSVLYGDYLASTVLMMLTWAWLSLAMV